MGNDLLEVAVDEGEPPPERRSVHLAALVAVIAIALAGIVLAVSLHSPRPLSVEPVEPLAAPQVSQILRSVCRTAKGEQRETQLVVESHTAFELLARKRLERYGGLFESLSTVSAEPAEQGRIAAAEQALLAAMDEARTAISAGQAGDTAGAKAAVQRADEAASLTCRV